ncbi:hypothetical protein EDC96DRAFT_549429 [Choanephora cucurbitarum]|nr:hypothetical protein EDC96DRAFT_549429 [Choanephora cucurbitarum]
MTCKRPSALAVRTKWASFYPFFFVVSKLQVAGPKKSETLFLFVALHIRIKIEKQAAAFCLPSVALMMVSKCLFRTQVHFDDRGCMSETRRAKLPAANTGRD